MISRLVGKLVDRVDSLALIDVNGVGFEVEVPDGTFDNASLDEVCTLYTHHVITQDAQALYAFPNKQMREFFRELIKINKVGPKAALAMLSTFSISELVRIVTENDNATLTRVKGIGKATADLVLVQLRNRIESLPLSVTHSLDELHPSHADAEQALVNLGYRPIDAREAIRLASYEGISIEELIRNSLKRLGRAS